MAKLSASDRFWKRVSIAGPNECWEWTGATRDGRYGEVHYHDKIWYTHRLAYFLTNGSVPTGDQVVAHTCDNKLCCNPNHLVAESSKENGHDVVVRGKGNKLRIEKFGRAMRRLDRYHKIFALRKRGMCMIEIGRVVGMSESGVSRVLAGNRGAEFSTAVRE